MGYSNATVLLQSRRRELISESVKFYLLLTMHLGIDAQFFFVNVYFNSLHVSSIQVLIIRRFNCINTISGICHSM